MTLESLVLLFLGSCLFYPQDNNVSLLTMRSGGIFLFRQASLRAVVFILDASRLFHIAENHLPSAQSYADDTQLYLSFSPLSEFSADDAIKAMEATIAEFRTWMASHHLSLNDSKTEFIIIGSKHQLSKVNFEGILVG